jgi:mevalonate kinase
MSDSKVRKEFTVHLLNEQGIQRANAVAEVVSECVDKLEALGVTGRELSIVITKAQELGFFAKRSIALNPENLK